MASLTEVMLGFFSLIKTRKEDAIMPFLSESVVLDDPVLGVFSGMDSFRMYVHGERSWLFELNAGIEPKLHVSSQNAIAVEYEFLVEVNGERKDLPVAIAADMDSGLISSIRIYYSTWTLNGCHQGRSPILPEKPDLALPPPIDSYTRLLAGNNPLEIIGLFEDEGYLREPAGRQYTRMGKEKLKEFYLPALSGGGIPLKFCSLITDGTNAAVEYLISEWNGVKFPEQAGISFYEIGKGGKIRAARIYDDADPPF